jgi:hypothetical protein
VDAIAAGKEQSLNATDVGVECAGRNIEQRR